MASVLDHNMYPFSVQTVGSHWVLYLSVDLSLQVDGYLVSSSSILFPFLLNLKISILLLVLGYNYVLVKLDSYV